MKGKLIKTDVNFLLEDDKGVVIATTSLNKEGLTLSIKNCQAIENGYDLDELAIEYFKQIHMGFGILEAYKKGFQKALELMGDKKFSEKDLRTAYGVGYLMKINPSDEYHETLNGLVQLLQQTEWDVEIVEEQVYDGLDEMAQPQYVKQPKLDEKGQLILKRK